jgi:tetratricopeptide (TPR) repeat protein
MKRTVAASVLLTLAGGALALGFYSAWVEREYRRLIGQGQVALARDDTFAAIEAFSGAIALKPDSMLAHLKRGETYRRRNDDVAAFRDLREASRLDPTATWPLEQLGDLNLERRWNARAAELYGSYVALDDRSWRVLYKLALAHYRDGKPEAALPVLDRALAIDGQFAEAHYLKGLCLRERGRTGQALTSLRTAVRLAPGLIQAREELADLYLSLERRREAIDQLDALRGLEPSRPERHIAVGLAYAQAGRSDLAVAMLGGATDRFSQQPAVHAALGRVWLQVAEARGDRTALRKALEALDTVAAQPTSDSSSLAVLGRALILDGRLLDAERALKEATAREPVDPGAFALLADVAERLRHYEVARDAWLKHACLTGDPSGRSVAVHMGDLSLSLGEPDVAVGWFERAVDGGRKPDAGTLVKLADAQLRAGYTELARASLSRALALERDNAAARRLARRLR